MRIKLKREYTEERVQILREIADHLAAARYLSLHTSHKIKAKKELRLAAQLQQVLLAETRLNLCLLSAPEPRKRPSPRRDRGL